MEFFNGISKKNQNKTGFVDAATKHKNKKKRCGGIRSTINYFVFIFNYILIRNESLLRNITEFFFLIVPTFHN